MVDISSQHELRGEFTPDLASRVHGGLDSADLSSRGSDRVNSVHGAIDILWPRGRIEATPYGKFLAGLRAKRDHGIDLEQRPSWVYDPAAALREAHEGHWLSDERTAPWTRAVIEMADHGIALNDTIVRVRQHPEALLDTAWGSTAEVLPRPVRIEADRAGEMFALARTGINQGSSTKSKVSECPHPAWQQMAQTHRLRGFNAVPMVTLGCHGFGLQALLADRWETDYIANLYNVFYLDYNVDTLGEPGSNRLMTDLTRALDYPDLPFELRLRRFHVSCNMAFFDAKRKAEAAFRSKATEGAHAWVFRDRERWRDYKAADSASWGLFLSYAEGFTGRNDLMVSGLTGDWIDIGPDLRYSESGNSVLTLTRGSITCPDLLDAYERTVWMINDYWTDDGDIKPERYAACMVAVAIIIWMVTNHRHDSWRYYALAFDACDQAIQRDLGLVCGLLGDCYTESFCPIGPRGATRLKIPRSRLPFQVSVGGQRFDGDLMLHEALVQAVVDGKLPMSVVDNLIVLPLLLRQKRTSAPEFLAWMDEHYCENAATIAHTMHSNVFAREIGVALCALVMELWWNGVCYAMGIGSLVEAQPGQVAHDRTY